MTSSRTVRSVAAIDHGAVHEAAELVAKDVETCVTTDGGGGAYFALVVEGDGFAG